MVYLLEHNGHQFHFLFNNACDKPLNQVLQHCRELVDFIITYPFRDLSSQITKYIKTICIEYDINFSVHKILIDGNKTNSTDLILALLNHYQFSARLENQYQVDFKLSSNQIESYCTLTLSPNWHYVERQQHIYYAFRQFQEAHMDIIPVTHQLNAWHQQYPKLQIIPDLYLSYRFDIKSWQLCAPVKDIAMLITDFEHYMGVCIDVLMQRFNLQSETAVISLEQLCQLLSDKLSIVMPLLDRTEHYKLHQMGLKLQQYDLYLRQHYSGHHFDPHNDLERISTDILKQMS